MSTSNKAKTAPTATHVFSTAACGLKTRAAKAAVISSTSVCQTQSSPTLSAPSSTALAPEVFMTSPKYIIGVTEHRHTEYYPTRPSNRPSDPIGWVYDSSVNRRSRPNWRHSNNLIGRILLGKLPGGITARDINQICAQVPLPGPGGRCWDWTHHAIQAIQAQRWFHSFARSGANGFQRRAYDQAVAWYNSDKQMKYAHELDMFGTERHCAVM